MNILLLSNSAPNYNNYFNAICRLLKADGARVCVATDCEYSAIENNLKSINSLVYIFSKFFSDFVHDPSILDRYTEYNLNYALLSDFERSQVYGIGRKRDNAFYEKLKCALIRFFETILEENSITHILYENVSNSFSYFAYIVGLEKGAKYCGLIPSRLPGRFSILSDPQREDIEIAKTISLIERGTIAVSKDVFNLVAEYLDNFEKISPDYMQFNNLDNISIVSKYFKYEKFKKIISSLKYIHKDHSYSFQLGNPFFASLAMFKRSIGRKVKILKLKHMYSDPAFNANFILYPLHFHPESSTSVLAGTYLDEYEVIRNIAFNLPEGIQLFVKDHISAWGYPSLQFYKKLCQLPNVCLLSPASPTKKLIKACRAVITLTSTVGYEALMMGKRVFLYGNVFYQQHPGVIRVNDPSKLFYLFKRYLDSPCNWSREINERFITAYYLCTYHGTLNLTLSSESAERLAVSTYGQLKECLGINS